MSFEEVTTFQKLIDHGFLEIGDGFRAKNNEPGGNGPIFLRAGHVTDQYIDFDGGERFHDLDSAKLRFKMSRVGDTVITTKGNSTGRTTFVTERMPEFVYSPHLSYWRSLDPNHICSGFLRYRAKSSAFVDQLSAMKTSTDMAPCSSLTDQRRLRINLPPIERQRYIAKVLSVFDDKIELNRRMNATLEAMAQTLFKSWFIDFDPVRAKLDGRQPTGINEATAALFPSRFDHDETVLLPYGWCSKSLYDCATFINGAAFKNDHFLSDRSGLPVIRIAELKNGITEQTKFSNADLPFKFKICAGEILFSWSGSPDTSIDTFLWSGGDGWLNQHIFKVEFNHPEEKLFVFYLLKHLKSTFIEIARNKQTTGLGHVTIQDLKHLLVALPPRAVLEAFQTLVEPIFERSKAIQTESNTLANIRDVLLPKLLSGQLSTGAVEKEIGG